MIVAIRQGLKEEGVDVSISRKRVSWAALT